MSKGRVLYLSYTGMLEPLGSSQVLNYLYGLSKDYEISLLSFERPRDLLKRDLLVETEERLKSRGISWTRYEYKSMFFGLGYFANLLLMIMAARTIIVRNKVRLLHCRSYTPAIAAFVLKKFLPIKYIFDIRGFWFDERADIGQLSRTGFLYKGLKWLEERLYKNADHVVSLTHKGRETLRDPNFFNIGAVDISVIPTCTDLDKFKLRDGTRSEIVTLGYVGTISGWYDFDFTLLIVKAISAQLPLVRLVIYNGSQHELIWKKVAEHSIPEGLVSVQDVPFSAMPLKMAEIDVALFNIRPVFSKRASAATKFGEFLACGIPSITNGGVGDLDHLIGSYGIGKLIERDALATYDFKSVLAGLQTAEVSHSCRAVAEKYFSLERGIEQYRAIYQKLLT